MSNNQIEKDAFWKAIEQTNEYKQADWSEYDLDHHIENLTKHLSTYNLEQILQFEKVFREKLAELHTTEILELYIILNNECNFENGIYNLDSYISSDGFLYFRCWLILKGEEFYKDIQEDINSFISGRYSFDINEPWAEDLLYVSSDAYTTLNKNTEVEIRDIASERFPELDYDMGEFPIERKPKSGEELFHTYPVLVKEICELRKE